MTVAALIVVAAASMRFEPPVPDTYETAETAEEPVETGNADRSSSGPTYEEVLRTLDRYGALKESGYTPTDAVYDASTCRIGLITQPKVALPETFGYGDGDKRIVTRSSDGNGGYDYAESTVTAAKPAVTVYGGYLLISDESGAVRLADPNASSVLADDISAYTPAYQRDVYGHPLFTKDGAYFYYNTPSSDAIIPKTETVTADDGTVLTLPRDELPTTAGMTEAVVDTAYFLPIDYDYSYSSYLDTGGIYRYHEHYKRFTVTNINEVYQNRLDVAIENYKMTKGEFPENRTEEITPEVSERDAGYGWQYIDADGKTLFRQSGKGVCDFSPDGRAVIVNWSGRVTVIDRNGKTVVDPYGDYVYLVEAENPLRDCYILPDTYGIESLGMFKYDHGALRIRRRLVDTGNGNYVKSETQVLISTSGQILTYPRSYTLAAYSEGLMLLEKDGLYGYMDVYGNWIVKPSYTYAEPFSEGLAVVGYKNATYGMIDTNGDTALPKIYKYVSACSSGTIAAYSDKGGWTLYRKMTSEEIADPVNPVILRTKKDAALNEYAKQKLIEDTLKDADKEAAEAVEKLKAEEAAVHEETAQVGSVQFPTTIYTPSSFR